MASLTSANVEIDEVQNGDLDFNLDEEVAEAGDVDEPQPKRGRIFSLDKIKELNSKPKEKTPAKAPKKPKEPKEPKVNPKHVEGKTIEQHRRGFGNVVRKHLHSFLLSIRVKKVFARSSPYENKVLFT
jgi:hypothetical protein